jgi:hypothetical protein
MSVQILCDLRTQFGTVRDQDQRPTCLAFAASDAHAALRSPWVPLSVEFVFYHAQRRARRSAHVGATLPTMLDALREDGQPVEAGWPYLTAIPADWKPSPAVGPLFRRQGHEGGSTVAEIIGRLDENKPALVLLTLSPAFDLANPSNDVVDQKPGEQPNPARRHAVVAVGYGVLAGQKVVLIRNSWGELWGREGHAWLTESYLTARVFRIGILTEDPDVQTHSDAG